jgi:two-component system NtrC family sensor kinase
MKKIFIIIILLVICADASAQSRRLDSLLAKMKQTDNPDQLSKLLAQISTTPGGDLGLLKQEKAAFADATAEGNIKKEERALNLICSADFRLYDAPALLDNSLKGIRLSSSINDKFYLSRFKHKAALAYEFIGDSRKSAGYSLQAANTALEARDTAEALINFSNLESDYAHLRNADSCLYYAKLDLKLVGAMKKPDKRLLYRTAFSDLGEAFRTANQLDSALAYYRLSYNTAKTIGSQSDQSLPYMLSDMAKIFLQLGRPDSALRYAQESYSIASKTRLWNFTYDASAILAKIYEGKDYKKAVFYLKAEMAAQDSINANDASRRFQLINDKEQQRLQDLKDQRDKFDALLRFYAVIAAAVVLLVIGIILWRNNRKQKRSNFLLNEQKEEIEAQRDELGNTIEQLRATQTQLIQSEKMASLGELTAGIAHEIQNPLNFVNNFSEVNQEMLDELDEELNKGDIAEAKAIAADIKQNEQKINHHGKRADAIVKGMLEHSRIGTGEKQPTDLNALVDEFLKLSYHGLRAKDQNFNAEIQTHFDEQLPKANLAQQDIGRVLLNLFNNAFYAVNQRSKSAGPDYKPKVSVTTLTKNERIVIKVKDNGNGIPDAIKDKIMQPFFTTKPTGEGTGLGLSLSYDIVVKGHSGSIAVNTKEGEFTEFTIMLPII